MAPSLWVSLKPTQRGLQPRACAGPALRCLAAGIAATVAEAQHGGHVPPSVVEDIQDAVATTYTLLQVHGRALSMEEGHDSCVAIAEAAKAMLLLLQVRQGQCKNAGCAAFGNVRVCWCRKAESCGATLMPVGPP